MLREQTFSDMRRYQEISETSTPVDAVEWFAKNKGITNLDDPSAKVRTIIDDVNESALARYEAKKAREAKARSEYIDALFSIDDGTAVLRQKSDYNSAAPKPKVARKVTIARPAKKIANVAKPVKQVAKPAKKKLLSYKLRYSAKQIGRMQLDTLQKNLAIQNRRKAMIEILKSGASVQSVSWRGESLRTHQVQKRDLDVIEIDEALDIVRVHEMRVKGLRFMVDSFERYSMPAPISCYLGGRDREKLFTAIRSGKLVSVDNFKESTPVCARVMFTLTHKQGLNIHSVMKKNKTLGWILLEEEPEPKKSYAEVKRESEVNGLGDMLQAIDYLKVRKEVAARMLGATAGEIEEAAFIEHKRVQNDGQ